MIAPKTTKLAAAYTPYAPLAHPQAQPLAEVADLSEVQPEPLQIVALAASLQVALAELQGRPLVEVLPVLTAQGFSKGSVAAAIGKQPYELAPSKLKAGELLKVGRTLHM